MNNKVYDTYSRCVIEQPIIMTDEKSILKIRDESGMVDLYETESRLLQESGVRSHIVRIHAMDLELEEKCLILNYF